MRDLTDFITEDQLMSFADHMKYATSNKFLLEGHFASWDIKKLAKEISKIFGGTIDELSYHNLPELFKATKYGDILTLKVKLFGFPTDKQFAELKRVVAQFGYHFALPYPLEQKSLRFQIEPRYPVKINDYLKQNNINFAYHITENNKRLEKIKQIGLVPKTSRTTYNHPGDRIYLMIVESQEQLKTWIETLAKNKRISVKDLTTIKVNLDTNINNYYVDDTATIPYHNMIAIFTHQNIGPENIEIL